MKFSTRHDIEAPIDFVFSRSVDFSGFEKQALRRGIQIERADTLQETGVGMCWNAEFSYRGKARKVQAELTQFEMPNGLLIHSKSGGIDADFDVEFLALSRNRTRVRIGLEMLPKTLPARLLVQSLKFAKSSLDTRFANRLAQFCGEIEDRFSRDKSGFSAAADRRGKRQESLGGR